MCWVFFVCFVFYWDPVLFSCKPILLRFKMKNVWRWWSNVWKQYVLHFFNTYVNERRQLHHHHGLAGLWFRSYRHRQDLGVNHSRGAVEEEHRKYFFSIILKKKQRFSNNHFHLSLNMNWRAHFPPAFSFFTVSHTAPLAPSVTFLGWVWRGKSQSKEKKKKANSSY